MCFKRTKTLHGIPGLHIDIICKEQNKSASELCLSHTLFLTSTLDLGRRRVIIHYWSGSVLANYFSPGVRRKRRNRDCDPQSHNVFPACSWAVQLCCAGEGAVLAPPIPSVLTTCASGEQQPYTVEKGAQHALSCPTGCHRGR